MKTKGKYCFMPPENLVENVGRDTFASHTTSKMWHLERARESLGKVSKMEIEDRYISAIAVDKLIEKKIYGVSWKSSLSYILLKMILITKFGFRNESYSMKNKVSNARLLERVERLS